MSSAFSFLFEAVVFVLFYFFFPRTHVCRDEARNLDTSLGSSMNTGKRPGAGEESVRIKVGGRRNRETTQSRIGKTRPSKFSPRVRCIDAYINLCYIHMHTT